MSSTNFTSRHIGPRNEEVNEMLHTIGVKSIDELIDLHAAHDIGAEGDGD